VYDSQDDVITTGTTTADSTYTTTGGLPSGSYRLGFKPQVGSGYGASFYRGKLTLASADVITVTAPTPRSGIDTTLLRVVSVQRAVYLPIILR
jgi:hypothetical protein